MDQIVTPDFLPEKQPVASARTASLCDRLCVVRASINMAEPLQPALMMLLGETKEGTSYHSIRGSDESNVERTRSR
jgi:hypothetical protein